jgi:pyridoxamine 5'-phosphate oxidase
MEDEMFTFYTNYKSRKARHLENNPYATMHFPWFSMERQVIVSGKVTKVAVDQSDEYFQSRPLMSRLGAWASRQSEVLDSRETLEKAFIDARDKLGEQPEKPPHWGGYALEPDSIEFWQGGPSRLHDRFIYRLTNGENLWNVERFYP